MGCCYLSRHSVSNPMKLMGKFPAGTPETVTMHQQLITATQIAVFSPHINPREIFIYMELQLEPETRLKRNGILHFVIWYIGLVMNFFCRMGNWTYDKDRYETAGNRTE